MIIHAADDCRDKHDAEVSLPAVFERKRSFVIVFPVDFGRDAVKAHVNNIGACFPDCFNQFRFPREINRVCVQLNMLISDVPCNLDYINDVVPERRLPARNLDCVCTYGLFILHLQEHFPNLILGRLIDWFAFLSIEETVPAGKVASVRDDYVAESCMRLVLDTQTAVLRAVDLRRLEVNLRVEQFDAGVFVPLSSNIHVEIFPVLVLYDAMLLAFLHHVDQSVLGIHNRRDLHCIPLLVGSALRA